MRRLLTVPKPLLTALLMFAMVGPPVVRAIELETPPDIGEIQKLFDRFLGFGDDLDDDRPGGSRGVVAKASDTAGDDVGLRIAILLGRILVGNPPLDASPLVEEHARPYQATSDPPLLELDQPALAVRMIAGSRPGPDGPVPTLYILNDASLSRDESGQFVSGEVSVDLLDEDGTTFARRISLETGLPSSPFRVVDMALSRDSRRALVAVQGSNPTTLPGTPVPHHLALLDLQAGALADRINLGEFNRPVSLALTPDGATAYVAVAETDEQHTTAVGVSVLVVDVDARQIVERIELAAPGSFSVGDSVLTPDGALLFVAAQNGVNVVDTRSRTRTTVIPIGVGTGRLRRLAIDPAGTTLYASDVFLLTVEGSNSNIGVAVIDTATAQVRETIRIPNAEGGTVQDTAVNATGRLLMHLDSRTAIWSIYDAVGLRLLDQIDLGDPVFAGGIADGF